MSARFKVGDSAQAMALQDEPSTFAAVERYAPATPEPAGATWTISSISSEAGTFIYNPATWALFRNRGEPTPGDDEPATTTYGQIRELVENESRHQRRANELSDRCGVLETEKRDLLVENATLRRRVEVLERDAKRGRR